MKYFILIFLFFVSGLSYAQNLVPNPSFEEREGCPEGYPDLEDKCLYWHSYRGTPDYFHDCSDVCGYNNEWGYQEPLSGDAYVALWSYQPTTPQYAEHIGIELNAPMLVGEKYYVSFFVSSAYTPLLVNIAINKIGALFTTNMYNDPDANQILPNYAHVYSDAIVSDTINWVKISGSFIADSAYRYVAIGRFFEDNSIDTLQLPYSVVSQASCYFLDDVCVSTDSVLCGVTTNIEEEWHIKNTLSIFPNPTKDFLIITLNEELESINVYNDSGYLVYTEQNIRYKRKIIDIKGFPNGLYLVCVGNGKNRQNLKLVIN